MKMLFPLLSTLLIGCIYVENDPVDDDGDGPQIVVEPVAPGSPVGKAITLDASRSYPGDDEELVAFEWTVTSSAGVVELTGESVVYRPIVDGVHAFELQVTDEDDERAVFISEFSVYNGAPVPAVNSCTPNAETWNFDTTSLTVIGDLNVVCVDFSDTFDPDDHEVTWRWEIDVAPAGGEDTLVYGNDVLRLRLDADGAYSGTAVFTDAFGATSTMELLFVKQSD